MSEGAEDAGTRFAPAGLVGDVGTLTLGCGLAQTAALRPRWGLIHSRGRFESLPENTNEKATRKVAFSLVGM